MIYIYIEREGERECDALPIRGGQALCLHVQVYMYANRTVSYDAITKQICRKDTHTNGGPSFTVTIY